MKKLLFLSFILILPFFAQSKDLWAFLSYGTFNSPEGPYLETYLTVAGNSVKYVKKENGKFQATVNVLMTFKQNNVIKAFNKYELNSPEVDDTANNNYEFIDQQRFSLPVGKYDFELQLTDKNKTAGPRPFTQTVIVDFPADSVSFSHIELVQSYKKTEKPSILSKSGYDLVPNIYNFYPQKDSTMTFYCEMYNLNKVVGDGQKFLVNYYIESFENNMQFSEFAKSKKETAQPVNVLLSEINIGKLATGNYNLVVEARDQKNQVIGRKSIFFQRSNPNVQMKFDDMLANASTNTFAERLPYDSIKEFIACTYPISSSVEQAFIRESKKSTDMKSLQQYFYGFWLRRDPKNPEQAWLAYKAQVKVAQANFGTPVKKGYETDRGRVFLQYGPPNSRTTQYSQPTSYPYEIWQYYVLNKTQRNKRFVFYSPDMVTSDFYLLHSDALGEVYNPGWQRELRVRSEDPGVLQETQTIKAWGENADDDWSISGGRSNGSDGIR